VSFITTQPSLHINITLVQWHIHPPWHKFKNCYIRNWDHATTNKQLFPLPFIVQSVSSKRFFNGPKSVFPLQLVHTHPSCDWVTSMITRMYIWQSSKMPILQFLKPCTPLYDIMHYQYATTLHLYQLVANLGATNTLHPQKNEKCYYLLQSTKL